ncbi:exodeoxyribonuclease VII large subunit [Piscirickettsia litoralis]|uniref:exodeoxyribonuclease VII large subunit n=1 Tax=Piscirickettsia litoralis TaxID=1891921 RepID=UPI0029394619|nr:exodeoxyribonuclease VII large subunit [Piscirickettsia litoralis]
MQLSHYLQTIQQAVENSFDQPQWVICEVSEWRQNQNGHIYTELIEQDDGHVIIAKSNATLWSRQVHHVLAPFIQATGAPPCADMKLLVQVSAHFHSRYGFSLNIHAIDPHFTLGALEAKLNEIRLTLQSEQIFDNNRMLTIPCEFTRIAVISSQTAAGLGDFRQEADRLAQAKLCRFDYFYATMQGHSVAESICAQLDKIHQHSEPYDAVIIIRGGGAKTDLAGFNELELARKLCQSTLPIFVGIGHERDHTILDEIAQRSFDTPSKVSHYILQTIFHNALTAYQHAKAVLQFTQKVYNFTQNDIHNTRHNIQQSTINVINTQAHQLQKYRQNISHHSKQAIQKQIHLINSHKQQLQTTHYTLNQYQLKLRKDFQFILQTSKETANTTQFSSESLMQFILGLGPEKTLQRGFSYIKHGDQYITSYKQASGYNTLNIHFKDGILSTTNNHNPED